MSKPVPWIVYILQCGDKTLYTGVTLDLERRLAEHASGNGAKYTRGRAPHTIIYTEMQPTRSRALKREMEIKRLSREQKLKLVEAAV